MNRIVQRFDELKTRGETAFIPYITAGDPSIEQTEKIVLALADAGCDVIEFGVPFSDPVGDGPVIAEAAQRALARGATLDRILDLVKRLRARTQVPILLFSYYNPLLAFGIPRFAREAAAAGVDGVLCVDLPAEEADEYKAELEQAGLCTVFLVAPTTSEDRLETILSRCSGFVYYVSRARSYRRARRSCRGPSQCARTHQTPHGQARRRWLWHQYAGPGARGCGHG